MENCGTTILLASELENYWYRIYVHVKVERLVIQNNNPCTLQITIVS